MRGLVKKLVFSCFFVLSLASCGVYTFSGASIPEQMKTVSVAYFDNQATTVVSSLSQSLTEALKTRIRNQTSLSLVAAQMKADGVFEGRITDYTVKPLALQSNETAAMNRLSITVSVKYTCIVDPKLDFEQSFTRYQDFSTSSQSFAQQETTLIGQINTQLIEDIFNRAFANW